MTIYFLTCGYKVIVNILVLEGTYSGRDKGITLS